MPVRRPQALIEQSAIFILVAVCATSKEFSNCKYSANTLAKPVTQGARFAVVTAADIPFPRALTRTPSLRRPAQAVLYLSVIFLQCAPGYRAARGRYHRPGAGCDCLQNGNNEYFLAIEHPTPICYGLVPKSFY